MPVNPESDLLAPVNHVFVDFENVHEIDLSVMADKTVHFTLLVGAQKKKLDIDLVEKMMERSDSVQLVRLRSTGRNALDFALAYYLGRATVSDPAAYFHIISGDAGYDPLVEHLKRMHFRVRRHDNFSTLTFSAPSKPKAHPSEDLFARVVANLRTNSETWPKRKKTLDGKLRNFLGKTATDQGVVALEKRLCDEGYANVNPNGAVTYNV